MIDPERQETKATLAELHLRLAWLETSIAQFRTDLALLQRIVDAAPTGK